MDAGLPHLTSPGQPRGSERSGHLSWATQHSHRARAGCLWASCQGPLPFLSETAVYWREETVPHLTPACSSGLSLQALGPCSGWTRSRPKPPGWALPGRGAAPSWATSGCRRLSCQGPSVCVELGPAPGRLARQLATFPRAFTGSDFCCRQQPPAGTTGLRRVGGTRPIAPLVSLRAYVLGSLRAPTGQQGYLEPTLPCTACKRLPGPERSTRLGSSCVALGKSLTVSGPLHPCPPQRAAGTGRDLQTLRLPEGAERRGLSP